MFLKTFIVIPPLFTGCPDHCGDCTYNTDLSRAECTATACDLRYGRLESDYTCSRKLLIKYDRTIYHII